MVYLFQVFEQLRGEEDYCLSDQLPWHLFLQLGESRDHGLRFRGSARLVRCIYSSHKVLYMSQRSVHVLYEEVFQAVCFLQSTFPGDESLHAEEFQTFRNPIVNDGAETVYKRSTYNGIMWSTSTTGQLQEFLQIDGAHVVAAKERVLLNVWHEWVALQLNLNCA